MFNVNQTPEFTHTVTVMVPTDGGHDEQTFKARFRVVSGEEETDFGLHEKDGLKNFLKAIIVSLDDLVGDNDKPLPYNDGLRDQMLAMPYVALALHQTYSRALTKTQLGN